VHCGPYTETKGDDASHEDTVCAALRGFGYPFRLYWRMSHRRRFSPSRVVILAAVLVTRDDENSLREAAYP